MLGPYDIIRLYDNVLHNDIFLHRIEVKEIRAGIQCMGNAYSPVSTKLDCTNRDFPDFNNPAFRCAYLHKYAPLHTFIVLDVMLRILREKGDVFWQLINTGRFKLCCLGGGPGTDVIGVLAALYTAFNNFKSSVTVIDCMKEWEVTFSSILQELVFGRYGPVWSSLSNKFHSYYIGCDLLQDMTNEVNKAIASASFITMVKFVSAASCTKTEPMLEKIFRCMKPGALVLFIDNAAGGFTQLIERASQKNSFQMIIPPQRHVKYENGNFKIDRFGYASCFKVTVTYLLLRKSPNANDNLNLNSRKTVDPTLFVPQASSNACTYDNANDNLNHGKRDDPTPSVLQASSVNAHNSSKRADPKPSVLQASSGIAHLSANANTNLNHNSATIIAPKQPAQCKSSSSNSIISSSSNSIISASSNSIITSSSNAIISSSSNASVSPVKTNNLNLNTQRANLSADNEDRVSDWNNINNYLTSSSHSIPGSSDQNANQNDNDNNNGCTCCVIS